MCIRDRAIRLHYPEKKGYSERNLTYMCQFAKAYPLSCLLYTSCVDIRYTLFIIDKFAGAKHLVDEMTIVE